MTAIDKSPGLAEREIAAGKNEDPGSPDEDSENGEANNTASSKDRAEQTLSSGLDLYKKGGSHKKGFFGKSRRKYLLLGMLPVLLIFIGFAFVALFKIPNYAENIAQRRLARTALKVAQTVAEIDSEKIAIDKAINRSGFSKFRSPTWKKLTGYKAKIMYENLVADASITFDKPVNPSKIILKGKEYNLKKRWPNPWENYKMRKQLATDINTYINVAMRGEKASVRSAVAKSIRGRFGIKLIWWADKWAQYKGKKEAAAYIEELRNKLKMGEIPKNNMKTQALNDALNEWSKAVTDCKEDDDCLKRANDRWDKQVSDALEAALEKGFAGKLVSVLNPLYDIAVGLCMIYDGSMVRSGGDIDAQSTTAIRSFFALQTAADQQKEGETTAEAIGAFNFVLSADPKGKKDDATLKSGDSVPDQYMRGLEPDTSVEKSPQTSRGGDFTLLDVLVGSEALATQIEEIANWLCPVLTNTWFMGFIGGASLLVGPLKAALQSLTMVVKRIIVNLTLKAFLFAIPKIIWGTAKFVWGFGWRFGLMYAGIEGTTAYAKILVTQQAGTVNDGATSSGGSFKDQADMGGDLQNNEMQRQMYYGAPLTNKQVIESDKEVAVYLNDMEKSKPASQRYFALSNPRSLISRFSYQLIYLRKIKVSAYLNKYLSIASIKSLTSSLLPGSGNKLALAADGSVNGHYGILQWGWTAEDEALIDSDRTLGVVENAEIIEDASEKNADGTDKYPGKTPQDIENKYGVCFTNSMGSLLSGDGISSNVKIKRQENGDVKTGDGLCSPNNLGPNNSEFDIPELANAEHMVFRWRLAKMRENVLDESLGMQNPTKDETAGAGSTTIGDCEGLNLGQGRQRNGKFSDNSPTTYTQYQLPDSPYYTRTSSPDRQWGRKELIETIYQTAKRWHEVHPDIKINVGDLDAPGHLSHDGGIDVDLSGCPWNKSCGSSYKPELAVEYAKMIFDTNIVNVIGYDDASVADQVNDYASQNNLAGSMASNWGASGYGDHSNHFHLRIEPGDSPVGCK
ncbi:MAG: hypothetical protein WCP03_00795 [Candidatus Saccharibacteria bacterium]